MIFALSVLLSSCLVYNSIGVIDETTINNLSFVANLTYNIHVKASKEEDGAMFKHFFPDFVWILRDFTLELVSNITNTKITPQEYLEEALME
mmetsp:Transcript_17897/g.8399  ORF Transcript_17897/g.8399 Transcript_17897/m.8399 type:complete len:92 (-) Transcript_17897:12-287(-)